MFNKLVSEGKTIIIVTHDSALAKRAERTALIADGEIVNEFVARALPTLTHSQLLAATRQLETIQYDAGSLILQEGGKRKNFYIISKGTGKHIMSTLFPNY